MAISVAQTLNLPGAYSGNFASNVAAGDTIFLVVTGFTTIGSVMSSSNPQFHGSTPVGSTKLIEQQPVSGGNDVYLAIWMMPNVTGGATDIGVTITNSQGAGGTAVGLIAYDVSGLGASPTVDKSNSGTGTSNTPTSGATGAISEAPELVLASLVIFGQTMSPVGAPWAEQQFVSDFSLAGYQIASTSGGSYAYSQLAGGSAVWSGGIVTVGAAPANSSSLLLASFP